MKATLCPVTYDDDPSNPVSNLDLPFYASALKNGTITSFIWWYSIEEWNYHQLYSMVLNLEMQAEFYKAVESGKPWPEA